MTPGLPAGHPGLTTIERQILNAVAQGLQSKEIAIHIDRSRATVEGYIRILYAKFGARSRAHLVAAAFRSGILDADNH